MIQKIKSNLTIIVQELFYFFACLWLALVVLEIIWPNIVLVYFNLNLLLMAVIIFGIVFTYFRRAISPSKQLKDLSH